MGEERHRADCNQLPVAVLHYYFFFFPYAPTITPPPPHAPPPPAAKTLPRAGNKNKTGILGQKGVNQGLETAAQLVSG